jgi:surfeit locus 1 family protein
LSGSSGGSAEPRLPWLGALAAAVLAFAILIGLGTWQLQRKTWKEALIASLTERLAAPPAALPVPALWPKLDQPSDEYRRVAFSATFDYGNDALVYAGGSALRPDVSGIGYWVFTPARLADGGTLMVNRGFVPEGRQDRSFRATGEGAGPLAITGVMRWPEPRHWFTPNDDPAKSLWFVRDPQAIAAAKGIAAVAPFYVEQETPVPAGGLPQPGKVVVNLPDNHLQYAVTWYGLAVALVGVYGAWAFGRRRRKPGAPGGPKGTERPPLRSL